MTNFYFRLCQYLRAKRKYKVSVVSSIGDTEILHHVNVEAYCQLQAKSIAVQLVAENIKINACGIQSLGKTNDFVLSTTMPL